jgi:hypothetical protein
MKEMKTMKKMKEMKEMKRMKIMKEMKRMGSAVRRSVLHRSSFHSQFSILNSQFISGIFGC